MSSKEQVLEQVQHASKGFEALLNNDISGAREVLGSRPDSASHLVGLGIVAFLVSILSKEDAELRAATETLQSAEAKANVEANAKRPKGETGVYPPGTEFKVLVGDATIGQALVAIMSESYVEFAKAVWKLNKSYKIFMAVHKTVFPEEIGDDESLHQVITKLNQHYLDQTTKQAEAEENPSSGGGGFFSGWGRKKNPTLNRVRAASSASDLPSAPSSSQATDESGSNSEPNSSPGTRTVSRSGSATDLLEGMSKTRISRADTTDFMTTDEDSFPPPLWANDPLTTLVISGAALGSGMFGLIFSTLPPKMRKMISWFGFSSSSRSASLKLLKVAASTGNDVHGYFASLTLMTYYGFILLMSGWQASEMGYLRSVASVLDRVHARFPKGTLWVLNRAKLARYSRQHDSAIGIIKQALEREAKEGSGFREADSLLVFELMWLYLSQARFSEVADAAERMCTLNSWSHATYIAVGAGALVDEINSLRAKGETPSPELRDRAEALLAKLPTLCTAERTLGEKPVTETFIVRRLEAQKAKLQRWKQAGRVDKDAWLSDVIRMTNAMELGLFWATVGGRSPKAGLQTQIDLLTSFTPKPAISSAAGGSSSLGQSVSRSSSVSGAGSARATATKQVLDPATDDLDTPAECLIRDLILGALYTAMGHYDESQFPTAIGFLDRVIEAPAADVGEERWVVPFASWHRAVVELKMGDFETASTPSGSQVPQLWKPRFARAEGWLDSALAAGEYDLKTRLESRILMLKEEIRAKKLKLGLA
ncbi:hypothetical protein JCM8202_004879 [Rhodotorula sphaerocarpa]